MNKHLSGVDMISFSDQFGPRLDLQGEEHAPLLHDRVCATPPDALVAFDLRGVRYLGYSYAKPTIRKALKQRNRGEYAGRRLLLISDLDDLFLEGTDAALKEEKLFMYVAPTPEAVGSKGQLVGRATRTLTETFDILLKESPITTGQLAELLNTSPQNAKNRIDRLVEMGAVTRQKVQSPTGGYEWLNRILPEAHRTT